MDRSTIEELYRTGQLAEAMRELAAAVADPAVTRQDAAWARYMLGRVAWKEGRKADAISLYTEAVALDPDSEAAVALEQARAIMSFYNKDLYNP